MDSLQEKVQKVLPICSGPWMVREITEEEQSYFREKTKGEDLSAMTCRPVGGKPRSTAKVSSRVLLGVFCDGVLMGRISLNDYNPRNGCAEVGYWTLPEYRGKTVMKHGLGMVGETLLRRGVLRRLTVQTGAFNLPSLGLMKALGWQQEGRLRGHHERNGIYWDDLLFSLMEDDLTGEESHGIYHY